MFLKGDSQKTPYKVQEGKVNANVPRPFWQVILSSGLTKFAGKSGNS
jgi:hypothetical protein